MRNQREWPPIGDRESRIMRIRMWSSRPLREIWTSGVAWMCCVA